MKLRQTAWLTSGLVMVSVLLAACSSSGSSSTSSSSTPASSTSASSTSSAAAGGLKTGLKVFIIPKNLGNSYFTTADSAQSGGAIAALDPLRESGTAARGSGGATA